MRIASNGKLTIGRRGQDTATSYTTTSNWTNVVTVYNGSNIKVYVNKVKIYDGSYSYNIVGKPNRVFCNGNDSDKLKGYLRENIFENIARTDAQVTDYYDKSKKIFGIS